MKLAVILTAVMILLAASNLLSYIVPSVLILGIVFAVSEALRG